MWINSPCPIQDITLQGNERFNIFGFSLWHVCQPGVISTHNKSALQLGVIFTYDKSTLVCWQVKIACMNLVPYLTAILTWYSPNAWYRCSRFEKTICTQSIHVGSHKLKLPEDIHTNEAYSYPKTFTPRKYTTTERHSHQESIQLPKDIHTNKVYNYLKTFTSRKYTATQRHSHQ